MAHYIHTESQIDDLVNKVSETFASYIKAKSNLSNARDGYEYIVSAKEIEGIRFNNLLTSIECINRLYNTNCTLTTNNPNVRSTWDQLCLGNHTLVINT